jgi:catechol 2,3-dioxygenase-like lactoylglutathione lyase family enzyme
MQIKFVGLAVLDQEKALTFYTEVVELAKAADIDMGPYRFLTVCGDEGFGGGQIVLEPVDLPPRAAYQTGMFEAGVPVLALNTGDVRADFERMSAKGVVFRGEPRDRGPIVSVIFEDTCGNLIHLVQAKPM